MSPISPKYFLKPLLLLLIHVCSSTHLLLPLTHTLTRTQTPTHHLLKSISTRSSTRFHTHRRTTKQLSLPLSSGSDYTISLTLDPTTTIDLFMDTGSDLVWFPCSPFKCIMCEGKSKSQLPPVPPPPNSTLTPCMDPTCSAAHSSQPTSNLCAIARCPLEDIEMSTCSPKLHHCPPFYYAYGDGSLVGHLRQGPLSLSSLNFPNFTFACSHTALAEPMGVAGFGRGALSLPNQLGALVPNLGSRFSYCLISHSFKQSRLIKPSPLILGRATGPVFENDSNVPFVYTPLLYNPKYPYFYSVGLTGITVGESRIVAGEKLGEVDGEGNGGLVVDSGTTFTMLPAGLYAELTREFAKRMKRVGFVEAKEVEGETGLKPCYYYDGKRESWKVPRMELHFNGNVSVELPKRNYFMGFEEREKKNVGCLMVMNGGDETEGGGGPRGTLGNFQQQGFEVVYDLEEGRVGFARRKCEGLWDEVTRG